MNVREACEEWLWKEDLHRGLPHITTSLVVFVEAQCEEATRRAVREIAREVRLLLALVSRE